MNPWLSHVPFPKPFANHNVVVCDIRARSAGAHTAFQFLSNVLTSRFCAGHWVGQGCTCTSKTFRPLIFLRFSFVEDTIISYTPKCSGLRLAGKTLPSQMLTSESSFKSVHVISCLLTTRLFSTFTVRYKNRIWQECSTSCHGSCFIGEGSVDISTGR